MIISVINLSEGLVSDSEMLTVIRAVNRQVKEDFEPYWGFGARLRLDGRVSRGHEVVQTADVRGDAILYLRNKADVVKAEGYHEANFAGIPYGFVFLELVRRLKEPWSITFSHEALELIGDPESNLLVQGPHPDEPKRFVYHWFEMCDAVQNEKYRVDGTWLSNFVLPLYFTSSAERGGRNDFLGTKYRGQSLLSFKTNPGGYIGFFDPEKKTDVTWERAKDARAKKRIAIKKALKTGRGNMRRLRTRMSQR